MTDSLGWTRRELHSLRRMLMPKCYYMHYGPARSTNFIIKQKNKEIIIGGGDLVSCIPKFVLEPRNYKLEPNLFVSTGGGATLDFLVSGTLPGIKALK